MKVAINGFGRIGKLVFRAFLEKNLKGVDIVAINELGSLDSSLHLMQYDSVHGKLSTQINKAKDGLKYKNKTIKFFSERDPLNLPWKKLNVDVVLECSGVFASKEKAGAHIKAGAKKVIISAPGSNVDATIVQGVNNQILKKKHNVISNGSCTTNCLAPVAKVLNEVFGIENGMMTTIHAYTGDQNILDASHSDPRRSRAAAMSMIPTTTGAAKAVGLVLPDLAGKLDGYAVRVPTPDVSMVDLTVNLKKAATKEEINNAMKEASNGHLKGVLGYEEDPLVSVDFMGNPHSSIFDPALTNVIGNSAKVVTWYDNEVGFSNRVVDLANHIASKL